MNAEAGDEYQRRLAALERGALAEDLVARELELNGWLVVARNWRGGRGELDLVVARDGALRFVEVKARTTDDPSGLESVTEAKQARIASAAEAWLLEHRGEPTEACFVVAVVGFDGQGRASIEIYDDAFDAR